MFGAIPVGLGSGTTQTLAARGGCSMGVPLHDDEDLRVSDQFAKVWARFAKTGDPSLAGVADWPRYSEASQTYLSIGAPMEAKQGVENAYVAPSATAARGF
ncbi:carboxylesterase family protein [Phenylobacterium koreense]|uniref:Carboxylesterase type B n=1 Tax=Phenylobacterium koreense TaxID=266125 RepID=A0ABV2EPR6_9CAUL